ncbi:MAG TPA: hypothetical protein VHZ07_24145 [Bryobacteraceae bacterium]|jgi:hypothetical protein|nr:hypothetical protein [Bryobacteraceae bacterium]
MKTFLVRQTVQSLTVCALAIAGALSGLAQTTAACLADNGQSVNVPIVVARSPDVARATHYPRPLILVDPAFERFSQPAKTLILSHECHHVTHSYVNEDQADVYAGRLMYLAGFSAEVTEEAAKEVFRFSNATNGHSLTIVRIRSITKGYLEAQRARMRAARQQTNSLSVWAASSSIAAREKGGIQPSDDSAQAKDR